MLQILLYSFAFIAAVFSGQGDPEFPRFYDLSKRYLEDNINYTLEIGNIPLFCEHGDILGKLGGYHQAILITAESETENKRWNLQYDVATSDDYPVFNIVDYILPRCDWSADGKTCERLYWYQSTAPYLESGFYISKQEAADNDFEFSACIWEERALVAKHVSGKLLNDAISGPNSYPNYFKNVFDLYTLFGIFHGKAAKWFDNLDATSSQCHDFARRFIIVLKEKYGIQIAENSFLRSYINFQSNSIPERIDPYNNAEDRQAVAKFFYPNGPRTQRKTLSIEEGISEFAKLMNGEENEIFPMKYYADYYSDEKEKDMYYISTYRYDNDPSGKEGISFYRFTAKGLLSSIKIHQKTMELPGSWY